jgi:uncharacterized protein YndB with AHSA1/START domain
MFVILAVLLAAASCHSAAPSKHREIVTEKVVRGTPEELFSLWTTREGVRQFFAPDAVIDPRKGGEYTIVFAPEQDPEGLSHGTKGARILAFDPGKRLVFEWITFTSKEIPGAFGPPLASPAERNVSPLPTAVEVTFTPQGANDTLVRLRHYGFPSGGKWDEAYDFFARVWPHVLEELAQRK